jgi:hypothetical protein
MPAERKLISDLASFRYAPVKLAKGDAETATASSFYNPTPKQNKMDYVAKSIKKKILSTWVHSLLITLKAR